MALSARPAGHNYLVELIDQFKTSGASSNNFPMLEFAAINAGPGSERKNSYVENGIAIVIASGVLRNGACYWYDETSYQDLQAEFQAAMDDDSVKGVLFIADTPGGSTDGCYETADLMQAVRKKKPLYGVASPIAYSAGYMLLSQCERIYCQKTSGGTGSIGVWCAHFDLSKYLEEAGIKVTLISAGEGKLDGNPYEPLSPEAHKRLKQEVARLYGAFVARVASARGLAESAIVSLGALLYEGSEASLGAGLADRVGSTEDAFSDLVSDIAAKPLFPITTGTSGSARAENEGVVDMDINEAKAAGITEGRASAKKDERDRAKQITALCTMQRKPGLAAAFIDSDKSVDTIITELAAAAADGSGDEIDTTVPGRQAAVPGDKGGGDEPKLDMKASMRKVLERNGVKVAVA